MAQAQLWFYDLFEHLWGLRNGIEHDIDFESQLLIRLATCEWSIRRLYLRGAELSHAERHPFHSTLDDLLRKTVTEQESWIDLTEAYLQRAFQWMRARPPGQPAITKFFSQMLWQLGPLS